MFKGRSIYSSKRRSSQTLYCFHCFTSKMKVEIASLLFLLGTVFATETFQINNQTFKIVPLGRGGSKFGTKNEASRDFKLFSVPAESHKKESMDTPTSSLKVSHTEDSYDCEMRISVSSSGLTDIEQLIDEYNNQKMICKVSYVNGDKYEGEMTQNMRNGNGQMIYANGEIYNGMWVDGAENGTGKLASLFVFSLRLSLGIKVLLDSSVYNGQFLNNSRTGNKVSLMHSLLTTLQALELWCTKMVMFTTVSFAILMVFMLLVLM